MIDIIRNKRAEKQRGWEERRKGWHPRASKRLVRRCQCLPPISSEQSKSDTSVTQMITLLFDYFAGCFLSRLTKPGRCLTRLCLASGKVLVSLPSQGIFLHLLSEADRLSLGSDSLWADSINSQIKTAYHPLVQYLFRHLSLLTKSLRPSTDITHALPSNR